MAFAVFSLKRKAKVLGTYLSLLGHFFYSQAAQTQNGVGVRLQNSNNVQVDHNTFDDVASALYAQSSGNNIGMYAWNQYTGATLQSHLQFGTKPSTPAIN